MKNSKTNPGEFTSTQSSHVVRCRAQEVRIYIRLIDWNAAKQNGSADVVEIRHRVNAILMFIIQLLND